MLRFRVHHFLAIAVLLSACVKLGKSQAIYSYEGEITVEAGIAVNNTVSEMTPLSGSKLLLFKQYLIEPQIKTSLYNGSNYRNDTVGYYFIDLKNQTFSRYGRLSADAEKLQEGNLTDKEDGFDFYYEVNDLFKNTSGLSIRDTIISNVRCKAASAVKNTTKGKYLITGWIYPTPELFPVQFSLYLARKTGGGLVKKISLRTVGSDIDRKGTLISEVNFEYHKLPNHIIQLIKAWGKRQTRFTE